MKPTSWRERPQSPLSRRNQTLVAVESQYYAEWYGSFMNTIADEARQRGWQIINTRFFQSALQDGSLIRFHKSILPEGISPKGALIQALPGSELVLELERKACKMVRIGSASHPDDASLPAVLPDMRAAGRLAAHHFAERGFRHVGYVGRDPWSLKKALFDGFQDAATESNMVCHLLRFGSNAPLDDRKTRPQRFVDWLRDIPGPVGLLAFSDSVAAEFCAWATMAGMQVPTDLAVLGLGNNVPVCECNFPRISSIAMNEDARMHAACELLAQMMSGQPSPKTPVMIPPAGIVVRASTDVLATADPQVAAALRYMWSHLDLSLSVDDIAREAGLSRRGLERAFRRECGRSINAELQRKRLETFADLLTMTDLPILEICRDTGFFTKDYLHRTFKRAYGMTPRQYRVNFGREGKS